MVVFHYDPDPFGMNQWLHLIHVFGVGGLVLNVPEGVRLHRSVSRLEHLDFLDAPLVLFDRKGETPLSEHRHNKEEILVFGPDHESWKPISSFSARLSIPQIGDGDLYSFQAGTIALYDRLIRG